MAFKFATEDRDYSDLSSGRVLYNLPGHPALPIRLASEVFQRCMARTSGKDRPKVIYDPCCGAAYHLAALGLLHGPYIQELIGSDVDENVVAVAKRNLGLVSVKGLQTRKHELTDLYRKFGKDSHRAALESAERIYEQVIGNSQIGSIRCRAFQASVFDTQELVSRVNGARLDIVMADVPYGQRSKWQGTRDSSSENAVEEMLASIQNVLDSETIVAVVSNKQQRFAHPGYRRVERFQVGKRKVSLLTPLQ